MNTFPPEVVEHMRSYVYLYLDPRDGLPFYVGKGIGNRAFSHLYDETETEKVGKIKEICNAGFEPVIEILRHGLTDDQAGLVEASVIDAYRVEKLTNRNRGSHSKSYGRVSAKEVLLSNTAPTVNISEPALLITINRLYRSGMKDEELYEATRGIWKVGKRREKARYAFAVYQGIVREIYQIQRWQPAGTDRYISRDDSYFPESKRWEFVGIVAEDNIRSLYLRRSVRHLLGDSNQNPIRYINC